MSLTTAGIRSDFTLMLGSTFDQAQEIFESLDIDWPEKLVEIKTLIETEKTKLTHDLAEHPALLEGASQQLSKLEELTTKDGEQVAIDLKAQNPHALNRRKKQYGTGLLSDRLKPGWDLLPSRYSNLDINGLADTIGTFENKQVQI